MTPNVSDLTGSPPKPVSTIQHNYSNIHAPIPRPTSLNSSRTQSSNTSPINAESPSGGMTAFSTSEGGAFTKLIKTNTNGSESSETNRKNKLAQISDLIQLDTKTITEDLVIRTLQSRFFNHKYLVSTKFNEIGDFSHEEVGETYLLLNSPTLVSVIGLGF